MGFATPGSAEDWQPFFDSSGFEKELQSIASSNTGRGGGGGRSNVAEEGEAPPQPYVNVRDLEERRLTMFRYTHCYFTYTLGQNTLVQIVEKMKSSMGYMLKGTGFVAQWWVL